MKTSASGFFVATLLFAVALPPRLHAQVTPLLSYQGRVQVSGTDFNGTGQFKFALVRMVSVEGTTAQAVAGTVVNGFLAAINVTNPGSDYTTAPAVTITDTTGSGAVAVANIENGQVVSITVQNAGTRYSQNPTITIAAPPSGRAAVTVWSHDGTGTAGAPPTSALSLPVEAGVFDVHLGDTKIPNMSVLPAGTFTNLPLHLRVWFNDGINGFAQLVPDTLVPTAGFAMVAATLADGIPSSEPADGSVTAAKLADGAVTFVKLANGAVGEAKLGASSVSSAKIADGAVVTTKIANAAITEAKLADSAVTTAKLATGTVTETKLGAGSVTSAKLADGAVSTTKIANAAVTEAKLATAAVTDTKLADGAVGSPKLANGAVTAAKLAAGTTVRALNGLADQVTLAAGAGITINQNANTLTVAATGSGTDTGWGLTGNTGTSPTTDYLGTSDNQPLELRAFAQRGLRLEPTAQTDTINLIGGSAANSSGGALGVTIAGGGSPGDPNLVTASFGVIGGGLGNEVNAASAVVAGGRRNSIATAGDFSVIGGGQSNRVSQSAAHAAIFGGLNNTIGNGSSGASIFGGTDNQIGSNAQFALSLGGFANVVGNNALYGAVLGGSNNRALSPNSLAAGRNAQAQNIGSFVWADSRDGTFSSAAANEFSVRATGGVRLVSAINAGTGAPTAGVSLAAGATAWGVISDRDLKKNFQPVDNRDVLERLAAIPLQQWNYQWEADAATPHLGPMAQDFKAAFYPGRDDRNITTLEVDGVALAAIQGLNNKLESELAAKERRLVELENANAALRQRLEAIERHQRAGSHDSED
jgi:hypothetical protein